MKQFTMSSLASERHDIAVSHGECASPAELERECRIYTRYLIRQEPAAYVIEKYVDFQQRIEPGFTSDPFDRFLLRVSARGPRWTWLADSYASRLRKQCGLRRKLVLVIALLECASPSFQILDRVPSGGFAGAALRLAGSSLAYSGAVLGSVALFTPVKIWMNLRKR